MTNATYSTCTPGEDQAWHAEVSQLKLDYDREVGEGKDAKLVFKGVPILYSPTMSFSLNNQRKSGLLSPTFGSNSRTGGDTQPWYWNIAPNMDATITPRVMTKRGIQYIGELRYLTSIMQARAALNIYQKIALPENVVALILFCIPKTLVMALLVD